MSTRTAQKASRHLTTVTPAQVEAMQALDSDTLAALLTAVLAATAEDHQDVTEHAAVTVAAFYRGGGAADTLHAARAAAKAARRTVALARQAEDWDTYGDMTEEITTAWTLADARSTLTHWGTAPADLCTVTTPADVTDYAVARTGSASLARAVADYRAHDESTCEDCHQGAGRRVSLTGITAHREGWTATDSRYHASRRHTVAALAQVDREGTLQDLGGAPLASAPRHTRATGGDRTPRTTAPEPVVTHITRDGRMTTRNLTEAEAVTLATAGKRTTPARYAGEEYGVTTSPARESDRSESTGMVRSFKVAPSPRKRPGGNTGPTVPVRLS